jgi:divalent metal cation (Fe/Co/Zn/Cd) transporter
MRRLLSGIILFPASFSVIVQAAMEVEPSSPPSETALIVWVLVGVFIFFVMVGFFTWHLIKTERKRQLENKQSE